MAGAGSQSGEQVNVFEVDGQYLFKHYFDEAVFDRLRPYYNASQYRFEVPPAEFDALQSDLGDHGYDLQVVDAVEKYVVVVEMYTAHPENVFEDSVVQRRSEGHNCFLMTDQYALAHAVAEGATRLGEADVPNPFA